MEPDVIDAVLRSLQETQWGWQAVLPEVAFLGQPVRLRVDTRPVPAEGPPPVPNADETELARLVLSGLPAALAEAERQYRAYHAGVPGAVELAHEPQACVCREQLAREGPGRWSLVVEIAGAPDYGTHAEFVGLSYVGIWSGD
jgi:hypothetical protein